MIKPDYDPKAFFHWTEITVRFRDLDPLNHVNNSVFNTYFEEARIDFINHLPEFNKSMKSGMSFILAHIEISYLKPLLFQEKLLVGSSILELGNTSIKGIQAIYSKKDKELKSVAKSVGVWFDLKNNRPAKLPTLPKSENYFFNDSTDG